MSIFTSKRNATADRIAAVRAWRVQVMRAFDLNYSRYIYGIARRNRIADPHTAATRDLLRAAEQLKGALDAAEQDKADRP